MPLYPPVASTASLLALGVRFWYRLVVLASVPVGYWRLGEPSGTVAVDEMAANHGTYVNTPTLGAASLLTGDPDTAVTFAAASTETVTLPIAAALHPSTVSIAVWLKTTTAGYGGAMALYDGSSGWEMGLDSGSRLYGYLRGSSSIGLIDTGTGATINDGVRHLCVMVGTPTTLNLYLDGVAYKNTTGTWTLGSLPNVYPTIGSRSTGLYFNGTLDEAVIWNRALSAVEIAALYRIGSGT